MLEELIGQGKAKEILSVGLLHDKLPQTLVFAGPKGVGRKTAARLVANYLHGSDKANHPDTFWFSEIFNPLKEAEEQSPFKKTMDQFMKFVGLSPAASKKKIAIIDEADDLTTEAQNALLKTLEEPHPDTVLILIVEQENVLLPTILSRAQVIRFSPLSDEEIKRAMPDVSDEILAVANGSLGFVKELAEGAEEASEMIGFWQKVEEMSINDIFAITEKTKERIKAQQFLEVGLRYHMAQMLKSPDMDHARWVERIQEAILRIGNNVNPRLVLEALLLVQKEKIW